MLELKAKTRIQTGRQTEILRQTGMIPGVLYGPGLENKNLAVDAKEFLKLFRETGKSSLFSLTVDGKEKFMVLVGDFDENPVNNGLNHIDFYQPNLNEEIEADVPLVFEGESPAVKGGCTLVKNISEITVKALPANLPREIKVDVSKLVDVDDMILVKDLKVDGKVELQKNPEEIVVLAASAQKVEEELEEPIEENVEAVAKAEKEKKDKEESLPESKK